MKRLIILSSLFIMLGGIISAQTIKTEKVKVDRKSTTMPVHKNTQMVKIGNSKKTGKILVSKKLLFTKTEIQQVKRTSKR